MDLLLRCPKCCCVYQQPKSLDCGHIICLKCLSELFHPESSPYINCPICTKQTLFLNSTIDLPSLGPIEELLKYYTDNDSCGGIGIPMSPRFERLITTPLPDSNTPRSSQDKSTTTTTTTTSNSLTPNSLRSHPTTPAPDHCSLNQKQQLPPPSLQQRVSSPNIFVKPPPLNIEKVSTPPLPSTPPPSIAKIHHPVDIDEKILLCQLHPGEKFKFFCTKTECQKLICTECVIDHNGHQFAKIPRETDKRIPDIELLLMNLSHYPLKLLKQKQVIEKHIVDGTNQHRETKERIINDIDSMINHLNERKQYLESSIDRDWNEQRLHLNSLVQKMTSCIDSIKDTNQITQNLMTERGIVEKELVHVFNTTGGKDDDNNSNSSISTSSSGVEVTPQIHFIHQDPKYVKLSSVLLKKYSELKRLEDDSNQMFNELITQIEWKWDPEFQYPQIYKKQSAAGTSKSSLSASTDHMMPGGRRRTIHSPPQSLTSTPLLNPATPPSSISPPMIQRTMTGSVSYNGGANGGFGNATIPSSSMATSPTSNGLVKVPSNSSVSSIGSSASSMLINGGNKIPMLSLPLSASQPNIASLAHSTSSLPQGSYSPPKPPLNGSSGIVKKNPVFGKLLTRKDSIINHRLHYLYSIGGEHSNGTVEMYDIQTNKWKYTASMITPTSEFSAIYDNSNTIYCFGGKETPDTVSKYDITRDQWENLPGVKMPTGRNAHCAVYDGRRYVYLLGGVGSAKSMDRFDLLTKQFVSLKSMTFGRTYFNAFYNGTKFIYAVDGYANKDKRSSIEMYDIEKDVWTTVATIKTPRYMASVTYDSRYIMIEAGIDRCTSRDCKNSERFDTLNLSWESVSLEESIAKSKSKIHFINSSLFDGGQIVYYIGINIDDSLPLLYRYNIRTKRLEQLASLTHMRLTHQLVMITK